MSSNPGYLGIQLSTLREIRLTYSLFQLDYSWITQCGSARSYCIARLHSRSVHVRCDTVLAVVRSLYRFYYLGLLPLSL